MKTTLSPIFAALLLTACAESGDSGHSTAITEACDQSPAGQVTVVESWIRPTPEGRPMSAAYLTVCNRSDTNLILTGVEATIAQTVELHETTRDRDGVASMAPVDTIEIAPGGSVSLEPGGKHIMLIGVKEPIAAGDDVNLTLQFEAAPSIDLSVKARDENAAMGGHKGH